MLKEVSSLLEREVSERLPEPPATLGTSEKVPIKQMVALAATCSQTVSQETVETEAVSSQNLFSFKEAEVQEVSLKIEKSSLEDVLLEYVKETEGEVDLMQCSVELNASHSEIEKALQNLGAKGKVVIETKAR